MGPGGNPAYLDTRERGRAHQGTNACLCLSLPRMSTGSPSRTRSPDVLAETSVFGSHKHRLVAPSGEGWLSFECPTPGDETELMSLQSSCG